MIARGRGAGRALLVGLAVVATGAPGCQSRPDGAGPALEVRLAAEGGSRAARPGADEVRRAAAISVALVLGTVAPRDAADLADALEDMSDRLEARSHPLGIDLGEGEPDALVRAWLSGHASSVAAARSLARGRWQSADGSMSVRFIRGCDEAAPGARCVLAWGASGDAVDRRARFLAGPLSQAALLRAGTEAEAAALADGLAMACSREGSTIALVASGPHETLAPGDAEARIRAAARRSMRFAGPMPEDDRAWLGALARDDDAAALGEIGLAGSQVLVVPRLSADPARFAEEIDVVVREGRARDMITWERHPGG